MIIFLFFIVTLIIFNLLTFLSGLALWYIPLWLFLGFIGGYLFVGLTIVFTLPLVFWGKETNRLKHFYLRNMCDFTRLFVLRLHITEVIGLENIPQNTNFGIYGNHRSGADPLVVLSALRVPMAFAAKDSLFKSKFVSKWLKGFGILKINRENNREALKEIIHGIDLMNEGLSMLVFPEGTRKKEDFHNLDTFKAGAFRLTTKPKLPILPIAIVGAEKYGKQYIKKRTKTKIIIGKPFYYEDYKDLTTSELSNRVAKRIMILLKENEKLQ